MDITVYTNGEQYYYDSDLKRIITKGNLRSLMEQEGVNFKVVDMSLYREQKVNYQEDSNNPYYEQNLFIPYNTSEVESINNRVFSSDGAVIGGGQDSSYQFEFEKVRYAWPKRDDYLNNLMLDLYRADQPNSVADVNFVINLPEDTDFPTIEVNDSEKAFSHLVRLKKGTYKFHVRYTPNMLGNKHNYDSEGAIRSCNDLKMVCSREQYMEKVKDWKNLSKVFTLGFNDELQVDFVTVINTKNSLNNNPGNSRIASTSRHLNSRNIEFDDVLDYVNTYSNNTRAGRRR